MIYFKKLISQNSEVYTFCDQDIIGKKIKNKNSNIEISERFYKGNLIKDDEAIILMEQARNVNIIGKNSIKLALKAKIIDKENIIKIKNIPHALVFEI